MCIMSYNSSSYCAYLLLKIVLFNDLIGIRQQKK